MWQDGSINVPFEVVTPGFGRIFQDLGLLPVPSATRGKRKDGSSKMAPTAVPEEAIGRWRYWKRDPAFSSLILDTEALEEANSLGELSQDSCVALIVCSSHPSLFCLCSWRMHAAAVARPPSVQERHPTYIPLC